MKGFVQSRPGYEPKVNFAFFAAGASHMRMSLNAVPQSEAVPAILYRQWLVAPNGKSTCTLIVGDSTATLNLNFRQPTNAIADQLLTWLTRELPQ